jgi:peptide/nickel transport system substrate-binding protein
LAAALLPACGGSRVSGDTPPPATVLRLGIALPSPERVTAFVNSLASDSLVGIAWDGRPVERIVSSWEWTDDRLGLKLRLSPRVVFHDGTPLDLDYFRQSLESTLKAAQQPDSNVSFGSVKGVEIDPKAEPKDTVVIRLTRPEAFLLTDLANVSIPHPTNPQLSTGPFMIEGSAAKARLTAFKDYYRGTPKIAAIEVQNFGEQRATWAALMRNDIDAVHEIAPNLVPFVEVEGQTAVRSYPFLRPYYFQLVFNVRNPLLKNPAVRQALSHGVDRQAIVDGALNKQGMVAEGPIWPYYWAYSTAQKTYTRNHEAATLRLDTAGLTMKSSTKGRMPSRLHLRCLVVEKNQQYERLALWLQKQLYEIGVDLEVQALPVNELMKRLQSGDYETLLIQRTSGRSLAWTYLTFHSSNSVNGYAAADEVLDRLRQTTAESEIRASVGDLQQIFYENPPAIFIAWPQVARVVNSRFQVPDEAGRDVLSSLWQWRPVPVNP